MNNINYIVIQGRLCRDPIVRHLASGSTVANFSLAANTRYKSRSGETAEETAFINCTVWGKLAEWLAEHHKGELLLVQGRMKTETWDQAGNTQSRLVVICDEVHFLDPRSRDAASGTGKNATPAEPVLAKASDKDNPPF